MTVPGWRRREAQIRALESAAAAAAVAGLAGRLDTVTGAVRSGWERATSGGVVTSFGEWLATRRAAARDLRGIRPDVATRLRRFLPRAAALGAANAGGPLPDGHDPERAVAVARVIDGVDNAVTLRLRHAANALTDSPASTIRQVAAAITRIVAARHVAETAAVDAVTAAHADGTLATARTLGIRLRWTAEPDACKVCQSLHGATARPGEMFKPLRRLSPRVLDGYRQPPDPHPRCRCRIVPVDIPAPRRPTTPAPQAPGETLAAAGRRWLNILARGRQPRR